MSLLSRINDLQTRRAFLNRTGVGLGATVLGSLAASRGHASESTSHHAPKAKRVIFLFMAGAPSQLDLYDGKPDLAKKIGEPLPPEVRDGQRLTAMTTNAQHLIQPSMFEFAPQGESGLQMSELLPHLSTVVDDLCLIKSMRTDAINHDPGKTLFCTGSQIPGKPSMGAWLSYGLGSLNEDLPNFVVLNSAGPRSLLA